MSCCVDLFLCFRCYVGFLIGQATISCYMYVFLCVFYAMCIVFSIGFADRPPLVVMCVCVCVLFVFSCAFDAPCLVFSIGFADRPPLVAT